MHKIWKIPIDDHLVKFAIKTFFDEQSPPFKIEERTLIGKQILLYLLDRRNNTLSIFEGSSEDNDNKPALDRVDLLAQMEADKNGILPIVLSTTLQKRSPNLTKLSRLNSFLEEQFKMHLRAWVLAQTNIGNNRYQAIVGFMDYYQLNTGLLITRYYQWIMRIDHKPYKQIHS